MVNHARTLILNEAANGSGIYIPPGFAPVPVPPQFAKLRDLLVPQARDRAGREAAAAAVMCLCSTPELYPYLTRFDSRITYADVAPAGIVSMCTASAPAVSETTALALRMAGLAPAAFTALFAWPRYVADLSALKLAAVNTCESVLRLGAVALAYAYQLERVRTGD